MKKQHLKNTNIHSKRGNDYIIIEAREEVTPQGRCNCREQHMLSN